jgi:GntR family transcriptional regulator
VTLPDATIHRDSPVPFYFQLAEQLEHEIVSGRWQAGLRLPSELDLCSHFGVSRTTVRQALSRLSQGGLVSRQKGRGTFVESVKPHSWLLQSSAGFFEEEVERMGRRVTSRIQRIERGPLTAWACDALSLPQGSLGLTLERVRSVNDQVAMYVVNHLPERFADAVISLQEDESLYQRLREQYGVEAAGGRRVVQALPAEDQLAELLNVQPRSPLVFVESLTWDASAQPFDCYQAWLRSDCMKIEIEVVVAPPFAAEWASGEGSVVRGDRARAEFASSPGG